MVMPGWIRDVGQLVRIRWQTFDAYVDSADLHLMLPAANSITGDAGALPPNAGSTAVYAQ